MKETLTRFGKAPAEIFPPRFDTDFQKVRRTVESYGIRVYIDDLRKPNTGIFDGMEIGIEAANEPELSLFVLAHLFGHTVQWNTVPSYRTIDARIQPGASSELLEEARRYEQEACRIGLSLLRHSQVWGREQWISDWCASDWSYLSAFYATGRLPDWHAHRILNQPLLEPLLIPDFKPQRFFPRFAF